MIAPKQCISVSHLERAIASTSLPTSDDEAMIYFIQVHTAII